MAMIFSPVTVKVTVMVLPARISPGPVHAAEGLASALAVTPRRQPHRTNANNITMILFMLPP
jgi:hypothetical protein